MPSQESNIILGEYNDLLNCDEFIRDLESDIICARNPEIQNLSNASMSLNDLLRIYYSKFFPLKRIFRWLSYGNERQYFINREFSFTLANSVYVRYQSFDSAASLAHQLQKDLPVKMDIGAVYNTRPTERKTIAGAHFKPIEHELVFDIDISDYDDVRICCQ